MTHSLFYKSRAHDFPWLEYSKRSVEKFLSGWDEIVLCLPEGDHFDWPGAKIVHVRESFNGYGFQQLCKLYADTWCRGDVITFQDSDTIWTKPTTPEDLRMDGKPFWPIKPFKDARPDQQIWFRVIADYMKEDPAFEGMQRHPFQIPVKVLRKLRAHCELEHGFSLGEYIERKFNGTKGAVLNFSEWNIMSAFALKYCRDDFRWIDLSKEEAPETVCHQGFTWAGPDRIKQDIEQFRKILGEDQTEQPDLPKDWGRMIMADGTDLTPEPHPITPLEDALHTVRSEARRGPEHKRRLAERLDGIISIDVDTVLEILKAEARKSPLHKARLMKRITAALAGEKKPQEPKKRRKKPSNEELFKKKLATGKAEPRVKMEHHMPEGWVPVPQKSGAEKRLRSKAEEQAILDAPLK